MMQALLTGRKGRLTMTNYEKIKSMSIEEMADFLGIYNDRSCVTCENCIMKSHCEYPILGCEENALKWLIEEVESNNA